MIKVRILDRCEFCDGEAYIFVCEDVDSRGELFDRYRPCEMCHVSGNRAKWVGLRELSDLPNLIQRYARILDYAEIGAACQEKLSSLAVRGIEEFNRGEYFQSHEILEKPGTKIHRREGIYTVQFYRSQSHICKYSETTTVELLKCFYGYVNGQIRCRTHVAR